MLFVLARVLCGCMSVPQTGIQFNPQTKQLDITSPKDVEIQSATVTESNGFFCIEVKGYKAKNNIQVIQAVIEGNAETRKSIEQNAAKTIGTLIDLAK